MAVQINPDLEAKLSRLAAEQGRLTEELIEEALERLVDHDDWLQREIDKGLAAADMGDFVDHSDIRTLIDSRYAG